MSTITKQWLQQTIAEMEEHRDLFPGDLDDNHGKVLAAFRIALASLEAEAVGEVIEQQSGLMMDGLVISEKSAYRNIKGIHKMKMMPLGTKFYTAPPAPVSVPISFDEWSRKCNLQVTLCDPEFREKAQYIWDCACDAMLQGASNSPVITDSWVACSERMPELPKYWPDMAVIIAHDGEPYGTEALYCRDGEFRWGRDEDPVQDVTHWMPLPAAPQQEEQK